MASPRGEDQAQRLHPRAEAEDPLARVGDDPARQGDQPEAYCLQAFRRPVLVSR
jgi:hypothetical protein